MHYSTSLKSVLKCIILAIILFECSLLDLSAKRGPQIVKEAKKCRGARAPLTFLAYGPSSVVTLLQQFFKRHCYVATNKPCFGFLKNIFSLFFSPGQWEML